MMLRHCRPLLHRCPLGYPLPPLAPGCCSRCIQRRCPHHRSSHQTVAACEICSTLTGVRGTSEMVKNEALDALMGRGTGLLLRIPAHSLLLLFLPMNSLTSTVSSVHLTLCMQREVRQTPMQLCLMFMARATGTCGMPSKKHAACLLFSSRHQSQRQRFCMETSDSKLSTPHARVPP